VVYGFHPFETYAVEVGKNLKELNVPNIEVISFTPTSIGSDFLEQDSTERIRRNWKGTSELRRYVKEMYGKPNFVIGLHCYPFVADDKKGGLHAQYSILFPAWNFRLEKVIKEFIRNYKKVSLPNGLCYFSTSPRDFAGNHSSTIEFLPEVLTLERKRYLLSKENGVEFTLDYIEWIKRHYLNL
jgi:hypothetical protein